MFTDMIEARDVRALPAEYGDLLVRILTIHADGEIAAPQAYLNEWCLRAPTAYDQMMIARISSQEIDHHRKVARLLAELDVDISDQLRRRPEDRTISALNHRMPTWPDLMAFYFLVDRVAFYQLEEFAESSYLPLARIVPKIIEEERTHIAFGATHVRRLAAAPETRDDMQAAIDRWFPRALDMFGKSGSARAERYIEWGIKRRRNEELRRSWLGDVTGLLEGLGLRVPDPSVDRVFV